MWPNDTVCPIDSITKEGGLITELSSNSTPTFYPCTVFHQPLPLPEDALSCCWPSADCNVHHWTGGVTGHNSIVYSVYALAASWTVYAIDLIRKNRQLRDLTILINLWYPREQALVLFGCGVWLSTTDWDRVGIKLYCRSVIMIITLSLLRSSCSYMYIANIVWLCNAEENILFRPDKGLNRLKLPA